jgi:hypothetical protein
VALEELLDDVPRPSGADQGVGSSLSEGEFNHAPIPYHHVSAEIGRFANHDRAEDLIEKFRRLLASPLAEGVAVIVEESYRLLPIIPPVEVDDSSRFSPSIEIEGESKRTRTGVRQAD